MNLFNRVTTAIRAAANNIVKVEPPQPTDESATLLKAAQARVDRLTGTLAQSEAREKRAEQAWRDARSQADALEAEADAAVRAGQDEVARVKLAQLKQAQYKVQQLDDGWHIAASTSEKLRLEIKDLQAQLGQIRRRLGQGGEPPAAGIADKTTQQTQPSIAHSEPQARLTNQVDSPVTNQTGAAPSSGLDQARIADLLKKREDKR